MIPFKEIASFGQQTMLDKPLFNVSWILGRFCNYSCSYCWPYANSNKPDHQAFELYTNTIDEIKRQARANGFTEFHFSFSGGEPTAYKLFSELVAYYADDADAKYQSVHMTTNLSPGSKWWNKWLETTSSLQRRSITASYHAEFAKEQEFGDKCLQLMKGGVYVTINQVMVPDWFERDWENALFFHEQGINVTLKPQSDPTASRIVDGYKPEDLKRLHNGMPQRSYTEVKAANANVVTRPKPSFEMPEYTIGRNDASVPWNMQVELTDSKGKKWYMDQAERFNAFEFNNFNGWMCNSGYQGIIIREPDGSVKRSYSCVDQPLGNIETGFKLFDKPTICTTRACVSSADSKIPKRKV